jgi:xanthine dehydrogenase accessory factor
VPATMTRRITELVETRVPFVRATVVRAQLPTSAHAGDEAIVLADGTMEGFVGGQCAQTSVRNAALDALQCGQSVLLRVLPDGSAQFPDLPGASVVVNPCLSGGAMEIFLEPLVPAPSLHVVGDSPTADAVVSLARAVGFTVDRARDGAGPEGALAVLLAGHGGDEPAAIRAALDAGVGYIGLVASPRRGGALLDAMELSPEERARIRTPVGFDIGARTAAEVALSIVAEFVQAVRKEGLAAPTPTATATATATGSSPEQPLQAVDPVCGMTVTVGPDTVHLEVDGTDVWFCCPGCRDRYARRHDDVGA